MDRREAHNLTPTVEAAALILEAAGKPLVTTVLVKALFYLDTLAFLEMGKQVTDATYVALKAGPVVDSYRERVIAGLERADLAMQDDEDPMYKPVVLLHRVTPHHLSPEDQARARAAGVWAKDKTATWVKEHFHENPGWIDAWQDGDGQGHRINMRLAIQQLVDRDPWLKEPLTDEERAVFAKPDGENFVAWDGEDFAE